MAFPKLGCCLKNQELYSQQTVKYLHVCRNSKKVLGYLNTSQVCYTLNITKPDFM